MVTNRSTTPMLSNIESTNSYSEMSNDNLWERTRRFSNDLATRLSELESRSQSLKTSFDFMSNSMYPHLRYMTAGALNAQLSFGSLESYADNLDEVSSAIRSTIPALQWLNSELQSRRDQNQRSVEEARRQMPPPSVWTADVSSRGINADDNVKSARLEAAQAGELQGELDFSEFINYPPG